MKAREMWAQYEELRRCSEYFKERDPDLSELFKEEASRVFKGACKQMYEEMRKDFRGAIKSQFEEKFKLWKGELK